MFVHAVYFSLRSDLPHADLAHFTAWLPRLTAIPGVRHGYGDRSAYFNWVRADYFCKYLLGQSADSVDIVELNREKQQTGDKKK